MKLEFKPEHFYAVDGPTDAFRKTFGREETLFVATRLKALAFIMAEIANFHLAQMLQNAPVVVCRKDDGKWSCDEHPGFARVTHKALLVNIEPIEASE